MKSDEGLLESLGYHLSRKVYERDSFSVKNGIWKGKGLDFGAELVLNFVEYPPPLLPPAPCLFQTRSGAKLRGEINTENVDSKN